MKFKPKITTVITTYHRPEFLRRAIDSVLSQTYPFFQVCVYDNGSDDATFNLMKEYAEKDPRVIYHRHPSDIGMMKNYQYGFSKINTPYFSFLSDDDFFSPWFYETALKDLETFPTAGFSACAVQVIDDTGKGLFDSLCLWARKGFFDVPEGFFEILYPSFKPPIPTCTLFNRQVVKSVSFDWNEEIQTLWDPCYLLQIASKCPYIINEKSCGHYLAHDNGFSSGFYARLRQSSKEMESYLIASRQLILAVSSNEHLSSEMKSKSRKALVKFFRGQVMRHTRLYLEEKRFKDAIQSIVWMLYYLYPSRSLCNKFLGNVNS